MKRVIFFLLSLVSFGSVAQTKRVVDKTPREVNFDAGWRFVKDSTISAENISFDDSKWRRVNLPHDWSIEDLPNQREGEVVGPFDKSAIGNIATGFTVGGTGWYRKKFTITSDQKSKSVEIHFDGVYMNSDVWLNGHHLGNHPYGYTPFNYDLTGFLKPVGQQNVIAVRVRNEGRNSRWYSGSGIYRHVWLSFTSPVHVATWGVFVSADDVSKEKAKVVIRTVVKNDTKQQQDATLTTTIISPEGKAVVSLHRKIRLDAASQAIDTAMVEVTNPELWSLISHKLYKAVSAISDAGNDKDKVETPFGIRSINITAEHGLLLNGERVILKGGCIHHDNGPLGSASIDRAEERKIQILKENGFNAIRLSHNPPSHEFLDYCDKIGMLVIDEAFDCWLKGKNLQDYHLYFADWWKKDLDAMILRDRNHPSVVFWSIGNEIDEKADSSGLRLAGLLSAEVHRLDPTRMVTEAINPGPDSVLKKWAKLTPAIFANLDVGGYNYFSGRYEPDHKQFLDRVMMGTETFPSQALSNYSLAEQHPYVLGDFVWTAIDYIGEASIGNSKLTEKRGMGGNQSWPWFNAYCGDIDLIGNKKPQSYFRDVVWKRSPIAMAVHAPIPDGKYENISMWGWPDEQQSWTWPGAEGKTLQVRVFSHSPLVRLKLNGKVIAEQSISEGQITAIFHVEYHPGVLEAVNVDAGKETESVTFQTTGRPHAVRLVADRTHISTSKNDLSYVTVEIVDDQGNVVPDAEATVHLSTSGVGHIAASGNGNPLVDKFGFKGAEQKTWRGKCLVIVQPNGSGGKIVLNVSAKGLAPAQKTIFCK